MAFQGKLSLYQWNLGHPENADANDWKAWNAQIESFLEDETVDFFNVTNFLDLKVPAQYKMIQSDCSADAKYDVTTLIYNTSRWEEAITPQRGALLPYAKPGSRGPFVLGKFKSKEGTGELVVVGTHLPPFVTQCDCCASKSEKSLKEELGPFASDEIVFLGDTNALFQDNDGVFRSLGLKVGAKTPTTKQTITKGALKCLCFFKPDRIITSLNGPEVPVTVLDLPVPSGSGMHNPITVSLALSSAQ